MLGKLKQHINNRLNLLKIDLFERASRLTSLIIVALLLFLIFFLFIIFLSIALAFFLGKLADSTTIGFLMVAFLFILMFFVILSFRNRLIIRPLMNFLSKEFFKPKEEEE